MGSFNNLAELVIHRAATQGTDRAYTYLADGETEARTLSYTEVERQASAVAVALRAQVPRGARVVLVFEPGLDFVLAFLACQLAGVIAVPVFPPRKPADAPRFASILRDSGAAAICTQASHVDALRMGLSALPGLEALPLLASDAVDVSEASHFRYEPPDPSAISFLQYTSGSTGVPKGVMVSHANLANNESLIERSCGHRRDGSVVCVTWLPQYHDMGLIGGILQPLHVGGTCVLLSPFSFLQHPMRWLRAITKYRGTFSGGPNFAYDLCVRSATEEDLASLDLSTWQVASNGAEPVRLATLDRFAVKFARCGFRRAAYFPCYGLAEATLYVTGHSDRTRPPRSLHVDAAALERNALVPVAVTAATEASSRALVGCGAPIGHEVAIVDPATGVRGAPGAIGEIWVRGPSVALGYWNREEATSEAFGARIADTGEGPFLRTGDLGVVHDGALFVTGRLKELIVVDGRNHYPHDIEDAVQDGCPALRRGCGAAFAIELDGAERVVVVQELAKGRAPIDLDALAVEVRARVVDACGLGLHALVFVPHGTVQKTSSGKIRRRAMRDKYLAGTLEGAHRSVADAVTPPPPQPTAERSTSAVRDAERHVASLIASLVRRPVADIDARLPFSSFGLDSRALVGLSGDLERRLGRRLEPRIFYDYATIAELAQFLVHGEAAARAPIVRAPQHGGSRAGGGAGAREPLAIVGMACRVPGARDLDAFFELLLAGTDAVTEVPAERWDITRWYDPDPSVSGKMATRWGGFIADVDRFDADFFGISAREAEAMDPQQRLLLELTWHALENAGMRPDDLRGSRTGVFVGISGSDYARLQAGGAGLFAAHAGTGNALSIAANRISYAFDLKGPSLAVDTACSSSLAAVHEAALHVGAGACDVAVVGGVNLLLAPDLTVSLSQNRMMAADGHCKTFSADADGYVRGEGAGVVVVKRLAAAIADGDRIWAVIAGSACNQDGRSNGLTAPNGRAQQDVIGDALRDAGWSARDVQVVETHGTGTHLGDPIEAGALGAVYGEGRDAGSPLILGALKTQIGHLEAAAGIAGLIKTALCLAHGTLVKNLHAPAPSALVRWDEWKLALPHETAPWPPAAVRRAGVSAFGFGGTNVHVLLEGAPAPARDADAPAPKAPAVIALALSAQSDPALAELSSRYAARLAAAPDDGDGARICAVAATRRHVFREARRAVVGADAREIAAALAEPRDLACAVTKRGVVLMFTGQGSQHVGMGRRLYATNDVFRSAFDACDAALREARAAAVADPSASPVAAHPALADLLFPPTDDADRADAMAELLSRADCTQPALFALEWALAQVWLDWGVRPVAMLGHSLGEIAAAAVAGVFSLADAARIVETRGRSMQALAEPGGMLAVFAHERDVDAVVARFAGRLAVAAFNGPGQMVLSGAHRDLELARALMRHRGIEAKPLRVSHAFHSPLMAPMTAELRRVAESVTYREPDVPIVSNVTGHLETTRLASADYWVEHVLAPVRFAESVGRLRALEVGVLLEIGPRPVLLGMARRILPVDDYRFRASLEPTKDAQRALVEAAAALHEDGVDLAGHAFTGGQLAVSLDAPLYPFARTRHWFPAAASDPLRISSARSPAVHPLLGTRLTSPRHRPGEEHFESVVTLPGPAFFRLHVEPAERRMSLLAYLDMALEAQHGAFPGELRCVRDMALEGLLQLGTGESARLQTICERRGESYVTMEVWAAGTDAASPSWRRVASATLASARGSELPAEPLASLRARIQQPIDVEAWYESTREAGFKYWVSPHQAISRLTWAPSEVLADVGLRPEDDGHNDGIWLKHSVWHACNQVLGALCPRDGRGTYFPIALNEIRFLREASRSLVLHARLVEHAASGDGASCTVDVTGYDPDGTPVVAVRGIRLIPDETQHSPRAEWRATAPDARTDYLVSTLRRVVARTLKRPAADLPIAPPLTSLGLDSLTAVEIASRVEQLFEINVNLAYLQQGASVYELASTLGEQLAEAEGWTRRSARAAADSTLVDLNRGDGALAPLFLVHPTGGTVFCYQELARHLGAQPVVGVQAPAPSGSGSAFASLEALAAHYVDAIRTRQARGPYLLGGWSMGGVLAFEIARQIEAAGDEIALLVLLDALAPRDTLAPARPSQGYALHLLAQGLGLDLRGISRADLEGDRDAAAARILAALRTQRHALRTLTAAELTRLLAAFEANLVLLGEYAGHPFNGTATLVRVEVPLDPSAPEATGHDWEGWLAGLDALHTVPGDHFSLLSGSHVQLTASYVRRALASVRPVDAAAGRDEGPLVIDAAHTASNVVIAHARRALDGGARAELLIEEAHPLFFDHPLDHVSGTLMLEGLLQLVDAAEPSPSTFLRYLSLTFPRFCEKDARVVLELAAPPSRETSGQTRTCRAVQNGLPVCTMRYQTDTAPLTRRTSGTRVAVTPASATLVHKSRVENVLIGEPQVAEHEARCALLDPPPGHQLAEGHAEHLSPLYALETARQLVTCLAHTAYGVPLGMPMNLVGVELILEAPLARRASLSLRHPLRALATTGSNTFAQFEVQILAGDELVGTCRLTAQLLTRDAYARVRQRAAHPTSGPAAAA